MPVLTKLVLSLQSFFNILCNTILYMIFQYCSEPIPIQRKLIGLEVILEKNRSQIPFDVLPHLCWKIQVPEKVRLPKAEKNGFYFVFQIMDGVPPFHWLWNIPIHPMAMIKHTFNCSYYILLDFVSKLTTQFCWSIDTCDFYG